MPDKTRYIVDAALAFIGKKIGALTKDLSEVQRQGNKELSKVLEAGADTNARLLGQAVARIEGAVSKLQNISVDAIIDTASLESELKSAAALLNKLNIPQVDKIETLLSNILVSLDQNRKDTTNNTKSLMQAIKDISFPSTFKLDDMQVRSIASSRMPLKDNALIPRNVRVTNLSMASANTEYSHTFKNLTAAWELRLRATNVSLLIAYTAGKLPTSGDGSAYFSVPAYYVQTNSGVDWGGKTLYLQTNTASQTLEIIEYYA